jgi:hypothetical protein
MARFPYKPERICPAAKGPPADGSSMGNDDTGRSPENVGEAGFFFWLR